MLLTVNPMQNDIKPLYDYSTKYNHSRYSPPESPRHLPSFFSGLDSSMSNPHRGLPAPHGMNLGPPDRVQPSVSSLGNLPAPPSQWTGQDESMRNWLQAKAEEDKRRQEEERTKQEGLRLDQRKIEAAMLKDSLNGNVPPPMIPLIFAGMSGMSGGTLSSHTLEWAQQYMAQLSLQNQQHQQQIQAQQHQIQHQQQVQHPNPPSPEQRRDSRMIPPNPYANPHPPQPPPPPAQAPNRALTHASSSSSLSRLNTAELQPQPLPSSAPTQRHSVHPLQQSQTAQSDPSSGPSLFFHHWTPPTSNGIQPSPSGKSQQESPLAQHTPSHLRSDHQTKKRKIGGSANQPLEPSPPGSSHREFSPHGSPGHSHSSSQDTDTRPTVRPSSRQQRQEELTGAHSHFRGVRDDHVMR